MVPNGPMDRSPLERVIFKGAHFWKKQNETPLIEQLLRKIAFIFAKHRKNEQEYACFLEKAVNVETINVPDLLFSGLFN